MLKAYTSWSVAAVTLYSLFFLLPPVSAILGTFMMIKPLMVTLEVNEALDSGKFYELPDWINYCSNNDLWFLEKNKTITEGIEETASAMKKL